MDVPTGLGLSHDDEQGERRRDSIAIRMAAYFGMIMTVAGLIFTAGYNWHQIVALSEMQSIQSADMKSEYVRKDVNREQMDAINKQLEEIRRLIATSQSRR